MGEQVDGVPVTDEQIQAWADEAETGYEPARLRTRGRPPRTGDAASEIVAVRIDEELLAALSDRAEQEHLNRSDAIRAAIQAWTDAA